MTPDVTIHDYHRKFIESAKADSKKYADELEEAIKLKNECKAYLDVKTNTLKSEYNIDLSEFPEYSCEIYDPEEPLRKKMFKFVDGVDFGVDRLIFQYILKYCKLLKNVHNLTILIELCDKRQNLNFRKYETYINKYMLEVHKTLLAGQGYKYSNGIGILVINRWMIDEDKMKPLVDHNATNIRKRQLLAEGRKLWDKDEAQWYHNRGIPYDGVDYRVFKEMTHYYEFCFVRSSIFSFNHQELDISDVISNKLRGNTYETFAEMCKSLDEIYNLQVDIKFKLHIMLTKYPGKYTNFIRNATQRKQDRENFK